MAWQGGYQGSVLKIIIFDLFDSLEPRFLSNRMLGGRKKTANHLHNVIVPVLLFSKHRT
jgi:hypothetical protein